MRTAKERLQLLKLDVTEPIQELQKTAAEAYNKWGRIDVVVNNAGAGMPGLVEEVGCVYTMIPETKKIHE